MASAPELHAVANALLAASEYAVVLDLAPLTFGDYSGMSCFVVQRQAAERQGKTLVLANLPLFATRIFTLASLAPLLSPSRKSPRGLVSWSAPRQTRWRRSDVRSRCQRAANSTRLANPAAMQ